MMRLILRRCFKTVKDISARDIDFFEKPALMKQELTKLAKQADPAKLNQLKQLSCQKI